MKEKTPLLSGKYDDLTHTSVDPAVLSRVAKILDSPTPVIRKSLNKQHGEEIKKVLLGSVHQQLLEKLYREHPLFFIALGHHRNTRGKRMSFRDKFLFQIYSDKHPHKIFRKCVQVGISEFMVIDAIFNASIKERTLLYVLPTSQLSNTFVSDRIDPPIRNIPYYRDLITWGSDNKTLKQFGTGAIYFTGAGSSKGAESQLFSSVPADDLRIDEYDRCALHIGEHKLKTAYSRLKSAENPTKIECANPKAADILIDARYKQSCQWVWAVPCEHCGRWQTLDWFKGVVRRVNDYVYKLRDTEWSIEANRDIHYYCQYCERPMSRFHDNAQWVALYPKRTLSGYHINRLMTHHCNIASLWGDFKNALGNNILMALFYGDSLGLGYLASNSEITQTQVKQCAQDNYYMPSSCRDMTIAGIDVHKIFLHVTISRPVGNRLVHVYIGKVINEDDIPALFKRYGVGVACFDAMPETRMLKKLRELSTLKHIIYAATFNQSSKSLDTEKNTVVEDRTYAIDEVQNAIITGEAVFPANVDTLLDGEFIDHLTSSVRVSDVNDKGKPVEQWVCKPGRSDHFLLSMAYELIARDIMRKTFNKALLDEMAEKDDSDIPTMAIPLFGINTQTDVIRSLYNNMIIVAQDAAHYTNIIKPALLGVFDGDKHSQKIKNMAEHWLMQYDTKFQITDN